MMALTVNESMDEVMMADVKKYLDMYGLTGDTDAESEAKNKEI